MKTVAVHNNKFHADDVFAVAILKLIYQNIKIVRTRDPAELKKADIRVDIGAKYNHKTKDYDHHQIKFNEKRTNGIPYAAAGLIWKHYGNNLVDEEAWKIIDEKIIQYIDADDNGVTTHEAKIIEPYTLREIIISFNPEWPDRKPENYDSNFFEAVDFAIKILEHEIKLATSLFKSREIICDKISKTNKDYLILDENMPFQDAVREESKSIKFVIMQDPTDKSWASIAVKSKKNSYDVRAKFPASWAGLYGHELAKATGVSDAIFCHKERFLAIAKSKEGAIKLVEKALGE